MPTVKIELQKGKGEEILKKIMQSVSDSVVNSLKLPNDDRNVRLIEYEKDLFKLKPPYEILIEISLFKGRTKETKKKLYQSIVNELETKCKIDKTKILIMLNEQALENWAGRGGIPADEMNLSFEVKI